MKDLASYLPLIVIFVVFYFLLIRPQQRRTRDRNAMMSSLGVGDRVVTIGGVHGKVVELRDATAVLQVEDDHLIEFERSAINSVRERANASTN